MTGQLTVKSIIMPNAPNILIKLFFHICKPSRTVLIQSMQLPKIALIARLEFGCRKIVGSASFNSCNICPQCAFNLINLCQCLVQKKKKRENTAVATRAKRQFGISLKIVTYLTPSPLEPYHWLTMRSLIMGWRKGFCLLYVRAWINYLCC